MGNTASAKMAHQQMNFQKEQGANAHQREVIDLRAAGLNPILSGTGGVGAAVSPGASAPQHDVVTPAVNTALAARRNNVEMAKIESETALNKIEAQRRAPVANVYEKVGAHVSSGIDSVVSGARAAGTAVAKAKEVVEQFFETHDIPKSSGVIQVIKDVVEAAAPYTPAGILVKKAREILTDKMESSVEAGKKRHNEWPSSAYERAQQERLDRARQSPASRRRATNSGR